MIKSLLTGAQLSEVRKLYDSPIVKELCDVIELLQTVCDVQKTRMAELISERDTLRKRAGRLEGEIETIRTIASGEEQVADDDTEVMEIIDNICRRAVLGDKSYTV